MDKTRVIFIEIWDTCKIHVFGEFVYASNIHVYTLSMYIKKTLDKHIKYCYTSQQNFLVSNNPPIAGVQWLRYSVVHSQRMNIW